MEHYSRKIDRDVIKVHDFIRSRALGQIDKMLRHEQQCDVAINVNNQITGCTKDNE